LHAQYKINAACNGYLFPVYYLGSGTILYRVGVKYSITCTLQSEPATQTTPEPPSPLRRQHKLPEPPDRKVYEGKSVPTWRKMAVYGSERHCVGVKEGWYRERGKSWAKGPIDMKLCTAHCPVTTKKVTRKLGENVCPSGSGGGLTQACATSGCNMCILQVQLFCKINNSTPIQMPRIHGGHILPTQMFQTRSRY